MGTSTASSKHRWIGLARLEYGMLLTEHGYNHSMTTLRISDEAVLIEMIKDLEPAIDVADQYSKCLSNGSCRDELNRIIDRGVERGDLAFEEGYYIQTGRREML